MASATAPLARSISFARGESLISAVLRLAHRLRLSPAALLTQVGLPAPHGRIPAALGLSLPAGSELQLRRLTRWSADELASGVLTTAAPGLNLPNLCGWKATTMAAAQRAWATPASGRFCPSCLQQQPNTSLAMMTLWSLPWHFVCLEHSVRLADRCPACQAPTAPGRHDGLLRNGDSRIAPATCRATGSADGGHLPCRAELSSAQVRPASPDELQAQRWVLDHLTAPPPATRQPAQPLMHLQAIVALNRLSRQDSATTSSPKWLAAPRGVSAAADDITEAWWHLTHVDEAAAHAAARRRQLSALLPALEQRSPHVAAIVRQQLIPTQRQPARHPDRTRPEFRRLPQLLL